MQRKREDKRRREEGEKAAENEKARAEREARRKEEEKERSANDAKRKEEMETRRVEQMKKHEEDAKLKEIEDKKKAEEDAAKRVEEQKILRQQQATLAVLRVLQMLSSANPENFDSLKAELEEVLKTELPETGAQQEILKAEADRVVEYAKQYVEQIKEQQKKWEELRVEQQKKTAEQEETAKGLLKELESLVTVAEAASESVHYTAAPIAGDHDLDDAEVVVVAKAVDEAGKTAMTACSACADFIMAKRTQLDEAESMRAESAKAISEAQPRVQAATRQAAEALQRATANKERIARRMAAKKWSSKKAALFSKYDLDKDGYLSRQEVVAYAKGEFNFDLPEESVARIFRLMVRKEGKGMQLADFQLLKTSVGIAREEARGLVRRAERLERERVAKEEEEKRKAAIEVRKGELIQVCESVQLLLSDLDSKVQGAEWAAEAVSLEAGTLSVDELKGKAQAVENAVDSTSIELAECGQKLNELKEEVNSAPELVEALNLKVSALDARANLYDMRLKKSSSVAASARQIAVHKQYTEYEADRIEVTAKLRACVEAQGGQAADLFPAIAQPGVDFIMPDDMSSFFLKCQVEVEAGKIDGFFKPPDGLVLPQGPMIGPAVVDALEDTATVEGAAAGEAGDAGAATPAGDIATLGAEDANADKTDGKEGEAPKAEEEKAGEESKAEAPKAGEEKTAEAVGGKAEEKKAEAEATEKAEDAPKPDDAGEKKAEGEDEARDDGPQKAEAAKEGEAAETPKEAPALSPEEQAIAEAKANAEATAILLRRVGPKISQEEWPRMIRVFYKVIKEIVLSDNLVIEQSRQIRRMEVNEVMEVYQGPAIDPSVGVFRIHGRALRDGTVGWVTIAGNQGITFLVPGGNTFKVARPNVFMTQDLKDTDGTSLVRQLAQGEMLDVMEWARTSRSALGVTRIRGKVQGEASMGWVTVTEKDGTMYLEAV